MAPKPPNFKAAALEDGASLLSTTKYDDDASSFHSGRESQVTDSEDEALRGARTSAEIREYDRTVLLEEEERDNLLEENRNLGQDNHLKLEGLSKGIKGLFGKSYAALPIIDDIPLEQTDDPRVGRKDNSERRQARRTRRRERRRRKKEALVENADRGEDGELMYEMEEGSLREGSATGESSETDSVESDRRRLRELKDDKILDKKKRRAWCFLSLLVVVGFTILVLVAWKLSLKVKKLKEDQKLWSNGTALFAPTTILISLDGFRADFLKRGITPTLNAFIAEGVSPDYMLPSFPSVTFPMHRTLVTGLYPESHGIVSNTFWDEDLQEQFYYTHPDAMKKQWWGGEALWTSAEKQGIRAAVHMWPGSEVHDMEIKPTFVDKYNGQEPLPNKVNRILGLLDMPGRENSKAELNEMRPQLIAAYVPNVDADGHKYGPNSTEIRVTIGEVDEMLSQIFAGLELRNLTKIVNVVVVSDHGMASTDTTRLIQLEDLIDTSLIEHIDGWPLYGLRPKNPDDLQGLYDTLSAHAQTNPNIDVYLRDVNMPERYHFSNNKRIAPLWIVPKTGWAIVTKDEMNVQEALERGLTYHPRGLHGYDHEHPLMRAIFVARGPAFPHKPNSRVAPFQNIEVYNIVCDSLSLTPEPNNGTLRLPLKTIGIHDPSTSPPEPADPEPSSTSASTSEGDGVLSISPIEASSAADPNVKPPVMVGVDIPDDVSVERPQIEDESEMTADEKTFWNWFKDTFGAAKGWVAELLKGDQEDAEKQG